MLRPNSAEMCAVWDKGNDPDQIPYRSGNRRFPRRHRRRVGLDAMGGGDAGLAACLGVIHPNSAMS